MLDFIQSSSRVRFSMTISPASLRPILPFALALLLAGPLLAQQNSQTSGDSPSPPPQESSPQFVFRENVNRVIVDVVVTDSNRKPVRGLTMRSFSIPLRLAREP